MLIVAIISEWGCPATLGNPSPYAHATYAITASWDWHATGYRKSSHSLDPPLVLPLTPDLMEYHNHSPQTDHPKAVPQKASRIIFVVILDPI